MPPSRRPLGLGWGAWTSIGAHDMRPRKALFPDCPGIYEWGVILPSGLRWDPPQLLLPSPVRTALGLVLPSFCGKATPPRASADRCSPTISAGAADDNVFTLYIGKAERSLHDRISAYLRQDGGRASCRTGMGSIRSR